MVIDQARFEHLQQAFIQIKNDNAIDEPSFFKDKLVHAYNKWVIEELDAIFLAPFTDETTQEALRAFFDIHWNLVKGTLVSPTALPETDISLFLCRIAPLICGDKKPIELLCTDIQWDPVKDDYPALDETIPLAQIIKSHILSDDGKSLIPVSYLTEERFINHTYQNFLKGDIAYKPYDAEYKPISRHEFSRLIEHSKSTVELNHSIENFKQLTTEKAADLYSQLDKLCKVLRIEDAHQGRGQQEKVGEGAFVALSEFGEFYAQLPDTQKDKIPAKVKEAIDDLMKVSGEYDARGMVQRIETCAGTRREKIEASMVGNEEILLGITMDAESIEQQKVKILSERNQLRDDLSKQLKANEQGVIAYQCGSEKLSFNQNLLNTLKVPFHVRSANEFEFIKKLDAQEITLLFSNNESLQNEIVAQISSLESLVFLSHNFNVEKLHSLLSIISSKLERKFINSSSDLSALLITHQNPEMVKLLDYHFGQKVEPRYDVLSQVQKQAIREFRDLRANIILFAKKAFNSGGSEQFKDMIKNVEPALKPIILTHALMEALQAGNIDVCNALLQYGIDVNQKNAQQETPLMGVINLLRTDKKLHYIRGGVYFKVIKFLIENKSDIYRKDSSGQYYFSDPKIYQGHADALNVLLEHNTNPEHKQSFFDAVCKAYENNRIFDCRVAEVLIKHGASINITNIARESPLYQALYYKDYKFATLLLERGCDLSSPVDTILNPLVHSDLSDHSKSSIKNAAAAVVKLLLEKGATLPNTCYESTWYAFSNCPELSSVLFEQGTKISDLSYRMDFTTIINNCIQSLKAEIFSDDKKTYLDSIQFYSILKELLKKEASLVVDYRDEREVADVKKADTIAILVKELLVARKELVKTEIFDVDAQNKFTNRCATAIEAARPVLSQHRSTAALVFKCIASLLVLPVFIYLAATGQLLKPKSETLVNTMKKKLDHYKAVCADIRDNDSNPPKDEQVSQGVTRTS